MIQKAKNLALHHVLRFLEYEAEHADIRDLKIATDIIKNLDEDKAQNQTNVLVQTLATKFNLPENPQELKKLYEQHI